MLVSTGQTFDAELLPSEIRGNADAALVIGA
jgi:hypothetical protein